MLQSMGSQGVRDDCRARTRKLGQLRVAKTPSPSPGLSPLILLYLLFGVAGVWKRKWQPPPVFLPKNPVDRGAWWAAVHGVAWSRTRLKRLSTHACLGEGNGSPLRCSCLKNPRDGGACWAAVYGIAQSRTRLKRLSSSRLCYFRIVVRRFGNFYEEVKKAEHLGGVSFTKKEIIFG